MSLGKVFHPGVASNHSDDQPYSWSDTPYHPPTQQYKNAPVCDDHDDTMTHDHDVTMTHGHSNVFCPVTVSAQPGGSLPDIQTTQTAVSMLQTLQHTNASQPFLMAVGLHKPHIPHKFPRQFLQYHPLSNISLPDNHYIPPKLPSVAWNPYTSLRRRHDVAQSRPGWPWGPLDTDLGRRIIQGYYSSVTYIDSLVGELVAAIDSDDTIIVLTSDHGWSLGQHSEWAKFSNYEEVTRVPMIVVTPHTATGAPRRVSQYVELVDMMPSLVSLAGLPPVPVCPAMASEVRLCTQGRDWSALVTGDTAVSWDNVAYSQYSRPSIQPR